VAVACSAAFSLSLPVGADAAPASPAYLVGVTCIGSAFCVAVGSTHKSGFVAQYKGGAWSRVASPTVSGGVLRGVSCTSTTNCMAVGLRGPADKTATLAEHWDGHTWKVVPSPSPVGTSKLMSVSCVSPTFCAAAGSSFDEKTTKGPTLVEHWNGTAWKIVPSPSFREAKSFETWLEGVSCANAKMCVAAGTTVAMQGSTDATFVIRWNGTAWVKASQQRIAGDLNWLHAVSCPAANACMAVGETNSDRPAVPLMDRWNGSTWHLTGGHRHGYQSGRGFAAVSCATTTSCLAVGARDYEDPYAERWDGSTWKPTGSPGTQPLGGLVGVDCVVPRDCYAVGGNVVLRQRHGTWTTVAAFS